MSHRSRHAASRGLLIVLIGLLAAACGTTSPAPSALPAVATVAPPVSDRLGITCGHGDAFHPSLLEAPGHAETDQDPAAAALRLHLATTDWTRTGWVRTAQAGDRAQFVARDAGGWVMVAIHVVRGEWVVDLDGACTLAAVPPAGLNLSRWWLDPAFPRPGPHDQTVKALVMEQACASGHDAEGRVEPPVIRLTADRAEVAIFVRPRPGGQDCQGHGLTPFEFQLPEALGDRVLLDAGVFPPRDATEPAEART